jgi:hypothetical protein
MSTTRVVTPGEAQRTLREHLHDVLQERYGSTRDLRLTSQQSEEAIAEARRRAGADGKPTTTAARTTTYGIRGAARLVDEARPELDSADVRASFTSVDADPDEDSLALHIAAERRLGTGDYTAEQYCAAVEAAQRERPNTIRTETSAEDIDALEHRLAVGASLHNITADRLGRGYSEDEYIAELEACMRELGITDRKGGI